MKIEYTKEWCMRMASLEGDAAIGVGPLAVDPTSLLLRVGLYPSANLGGGGMNTPAAYEDAMQILEDPKAAAWELRDLAKSLLNELLATQAREKDLRDALLTIGTSEGEHSTAAHIAMKTLNRTTNDTALKAALKAALTAQQERIAKHFDGKGEMFGDTIADDIRALGDQP